MLIYSTSSSITKKSRYPSFVALVLCVIMLMAKNTLAAAVVKPITTEQDQQPQKEEPQKQDDDMVESCTVTNPLTGNFFDLRPLVRSHDFWLVKGMDLQVNFTMNICSAALNASEIVDESKNSSAYYYDRKGEFVSLGKPSDAPYFRGKNLILEYTDGSQCLGPRGESTPYKKSSILVFKCDKDIHAVSKQAYISYVASANNCSYLFNVYTPHACPSVNKNSTMGPFTIFLLIGAIAAVVYYFSFIIYKPILFLNGVTTLVRKKSGKSIYVKRNYEATDTKAKSADYLA